MQGMVSRVRIRTFERREEKERERDTTSHASRSGNQVRTEPKAESSPGIDDSVSQVEARPPSHWPPRCHETHGVAEENERHCTRYLRSDSLIRIPIQARRKPGAASSVRARNDAAASCWIT